MGCNRCNQRSPNTPLNPKASNQRPQLKASERWRQVVGCLGINNGRGGFCHPRLPKPFVFVIPAQAGIQ